MLHKQSKELDLLISSLLPLIDFIIHKTENLSDLAEQLKIRKIRLEQAINDEQFET